MSRPSLRSQLRFYRRLNSEQLEERLPLAYGLVDSIYPGPRPQIFAGTGAAVAVSEDYRVVAAPGAHIAASENEGTVWVFDNANNFITEIANPNPGQTRQFGNSVALSGNHLVVGTDSDQMFAYEITTIGANLIAELVEPSGGGNFGQHVAVDGDIVVTSNTSANSFDGTAYVYDLSNAQNGMPLLPEITISDPSPETTSSFGRALAISGSTIAVTTDVTSTDQRLIRVYDTIGAPSGTDLSTPEFTLISPNAETSESIGTHLAVDGTRIAVGGIYADLNGINNRGIAYLFDTAGAQTGSTINTAVRVESPQSAIDSYFGSVALDGDRLLVGASGGRIAPDSPFDVGLAYVYDVAGVVSGSTLSTPEFTLRSPSAFSNDFGEAVSLAGDIVLVGDPDDDGAIRDAGAAYLYDLSTAQPGDVIDQADSVFMIELPAYFDYFGGRRIETDGNLLIASAGQSFGEIAVGSLNVYDISGSSPELIARINSPEENNFERFASSFAIHGTTLIVGVPGGSDPLTGASTTGAAYVYDLSSMPPTRFATLASPSPLSFGEFGISVAIHENKLAVADATGTAYLFDLNDVPPDGVSNQDRGAVPFGSTFSGLSHPMFMDEDALFIGQYLDDTGAQDAGAVYAYDISAEPPTLITKITNPEPADGDIFGSELALDDNWLVISAPIDDGDVEDTGTIYVYDVAAAVPALVSTTPSPNSMMSEAFGSSLALRGQQLAVGASSGEKAYIFDFIGGVPGQPQEVATSAPANGFGRTIALTSQKVYIGAPNDDANGANAGAIFVFADANGDFDEDGDFDCDDINALTTAIAAQDNEPMFDLSGDGLVDLADRDVWLTQAGNTNLPSSSPYLLGDANLDGTVDGLDFIEWNDHRFSFNSNWCDGDFTADGIVDGLDFIAWNENKFTSSDLAFDLAVPSRDIQLPEDRELTLLSGETRREHEAVIYAPVREYSADRLFQSRRNAAWQQLVDGVFDRLRSLDVARQLDLEPR